MREALSMRAVGEACWLGRTGTHEPRKTAGLDLAQRAAGIHILRQRLNLRAAWFASVVYRSPALAP